MSGDARVKESKTLKEKSVEMEKVKQDKKNEMVQFIERDGHFSLVRWASNHFRVQSTAC